MTTVDTEMEPMDLDTDNESGVTNNPWPTSLFRGNSHSPAHGAESPANVSDMDVDPGSPSPSKSKAQPSTSLEHIRNAIESLLSMRSPTPAAAEHEPGKDDDTVCKSTTDTENLTPAKDKLSATWEPAATVARGTVVFRRPNKGYGIPEGERTFAHFPEQSQQAKGNKEVRHRNIRNPASGTKESQSNTEHSHQLREGNARLKDSNKSLWPGCCKMLFLMLLVMFFILIVLFVIDLRKRQCSQSRDFNQRLLKVNLDADLYGQHIVSTLVPEEIESYFRMLHLHGGTENTDDFIVSAADNSVRCKPLVLSFHGWTGVGKNFVSKIISDTFPISKITLYNIPLDFPHKELESTYHQQIQDWIIGNFTTCTANMVIMDEMDKAFPLLVTGIADAIQALSQPCSIASPVIFLLLSNSKAVDINQNLLRFFQESSTNTREQLTLEHFSPIFQDSSDVWYSNLVENGLLRTFVPFLPLEKKHVIQCIKRDLISKGISTDANKVSRVLKELTFTDVGDLELSTTGCKRVSDKVDYVVISEN